MPFRTLNIVDGRAQADRENERHRSREEPLAPSARKPSPHVAGERVEPLQRTHVAAFVFGQIQRAELEADAPAGFVGRDAGLEVVVELTLHVESQLGVEIGFRRAAPPEALHDAPSSAACRMPPTAAVSRSQLARSLSSCARPFFVRR